MTPREREWMTKATDDRSGFNWVERAKSKLQLTRLIAFTTHQFFAFCVNRNDASAHRRGCCDSASNGSENPVFMTRFTFEDARMKMMSVLLQ